MEQSPGYSMLPPVLPNRRGQLSAEDWEEQRPRIEQLYSTEDKSLDDVIKLMEREYGFRATYAILLHSSFATSPIEG
jgi:hypothetical protein